MTFSELVHLRAEILEELDSLEYVVSLLVKRGIADRDKGRQALADSIVLRGVAGLIQDYYSGAERIFKRVADEIDERLPKGETWHKDLLNQMKRDVPGLRPRLLSERSFSQIDEYRSFRHLVANIYGHNLISERVLELVVNLPTFHKIFKDDILQFKVKPRPYLSEAGFIFMTFCFYYLLNVGNSPRYMRSPA